MNSSASNDLQPTKPPVQGGIASPGSAVLESLAKPRDAAWAEIVCILVFAAVLSLWGLRHGPALSDHEAIVATGARDVVQNGHWLIPSVGHQAAIRKPPLRFWLASLSSFVIDPGTSTPDVSVAASRFPSAIAAVLTVLVVLLLARCMFEPRTGTIAAAGLASTAGIFFFAHDAQIEMVLTFFSTCAVACFWMATQPGTRRRVLWWALFYLSLGLAMLSKAPLPLATVVLPLAVWWFVVLPLARYHHILDDESAAEGSTRIALFKEQGRQFLKMWLLPGALLFLLVFGPWPIYVAMTKSNALDLWRIEYLDRFSGDLSSQTHSAFYYIPIAFGLVFPWSLLLPQAVASPFSRATKANRKALLFALTWVTVQFVFLSSASFKRPHYLATALPGMAILLGPMVERFFFAFRVNGRKWLTIGIVVLVAMIVAAAVWGSKAVSKEMPDATAGFAMAAVLFFVGALAWLITYAANYRASSFVVLLCTVGATFALSWNALGQQGMIDERAADLMAALDKTAIGPDDPITWVVGRPDARLMYYRHLNVRPLFTTLELAPKRKGRRGIPEWLIEDAMTKLRERLQSRDKEYFIIPGMFWDAYESKVSDLANIVCRVKSPFGKKGRNDIVVFTQSWNNDWKKAGASGPG